VKTLLDDWEVVVGSDVPSLDSSDELRSDSDIDIDIVIDAEVVGVDCDESGDTLTEEAEAVFDEVEPPVGDKLVVGVIMEDADCDDDDWVGWTLF
jgi:hypothetical protein